MLAYFNFMWVWSYISIILIVWFRCSFLTMRRRGGFGTLVLAFACFVAYLAVANLLTFLGLPLPLGSLGTDTVMILGGIDISFIVLLAALRKPDAKTIKSEES